MILGFMLFTEVITMTNSNKSYIKTKFFHYVMPSVAAMWVYTIYTMVDGIFVARGVGR